jgi:dTDP-4-dehydrorhamnose reductase
VTTVVVLGANGQLGTELVRLLHAAGGYDARSLTHDEIEITETNSVRAALEEGGPDVVVNCAAFHRVDDCEDQPHEAMRVNALGALNVARACARLDAVCVHISTDYVFGGHSRGPYSEDDLPSPVNVYGVSKLAGEQLVAQACPRSLVVRVASLYGTAPVRAKSRHFVDAVFAKAKAGEPLRVIDDVRMSPTYAHDAARALETLIRQRARGLVHVTNAGGCSWYEFAAKIVALAGLGAVVTPVHASEYPIRARRPIDSSLRSVRATEEVQRCLRPWDEGLKAYLAMRSGAIEAQNST